MVVLGGARFLVSEVPLYRGTSFIKKRHPVGPYSRTMPRVLGGS